MTPPTQKEYRRPPRNQTHWLQLIWSLCFTALAAVCALYVYYRPVTDGKTFYALALAFFVLQGLATLCLLDAMRLENAMRMGLQWIVLRFVFGVGLIALGFSGVWTYDGVLLLLITAFGVSDTFLIVTSR